MLVWEEVIEDGHHVISATKYPPEYAARAIDGRGQVVDVYVSQRRATADVTTCSRRASAATGVIPDEVTTDGAPRPSRMRWESGSSSASSATIST